MITYNDVKTNEDINAYIRKQDDYLSALGFTEHSFVHVIKVAETAGYILKELGYSEKEIELAKIAGYMHDIGNVVNRTNHSITGAVMAFRILDNMHMPAEDIADIVTAIGNHDEGTGVPANPVAAALILADKSDVRQSRVRNKNDIEFDIHDRVNYSVKKSSLRVSEDKTAIVLNLEIDTEISSIMDYFEIFLNRMVMCRKAAEKFGLEFKLIINEQQVV